MWPSWVPLPKASTISSVELEVAPAPRINGPLCRGFRVAFWNGSEVVNPKPELQTLNKGEVQQAAYIDSSDLKWLLYCQALQEGEKGEFTYSLTSFEHGRSMSHVKTDKLFVSRSCLSNSRSSSVESKWMITYQWKCFHPGSPARHVLLSHARRPCPR